METLIFILTLLICAHCLDLMEIKYSFKTNELRDLCFQNKEERFFTVLILNRNLKLNLN